MGSTVQAVGLLLGSSLAIWAAVIGGWKLGVRYWSSR
jgi:hypothetical protein